MSGLGIARKIWLLAGMLLLMWNAVAARAEPNDVGPALSFDFSRAAPGGLPAGFTQLRPVGTAGADFRVSTVSGRRALVDDASNATDILFYETPQPMSSVEETYSFVYAGPYSVVEPFFVKAESVGGPSVEGTVTNLSQSHPGNFGAGTIAYRYKDASGKPQYSANGRLRTEPYFYRAGHTYRVDAIFDSSAGLMSTRIYDESLGPQTFDTRIKVLSKVRRLYPGIFVQRGSVALFDFAFGPVGQLPVRPRVARRASDYMNYLGYNAGVGRPLTSPISLAFLRLFPPLLIKHVRIPDDGRFLPTINALARYGIDANVLTGNRTTLEGLARFIGALALPPDAIELWNEPNNPGQQAAYDPRYNIDLPVFAAAVARAYPNMRIWGPSILPDPNAYPGSVQKLAASVGPYITAWNTHSYTVGSPENLGYGGFFSNACGPSQHEDCGWYGSFNYNDNLSGTLNPALPGITSEGAASFGTYPEICGHSMVDNATQQAYIERGMLYNYKLGHLRIFPYKFIDDGGCSDGGGTMGILSRIVESDGSTVITPKPAYVALVYMDNILADQGPNARSFAPQSLAYALAGERPDVEELLLAESDGSYRLALWSDAPLWDFNSNGIHRPGTALPLVSEPLRITFGEPINAVVYTQTPGTGAWSAGAKVSGTSVPVIVNQYPIIVAIAPRAGGGPFVRLPRDVPTPGPTETPQAKRTTMTGDGR